MRPSSRERAARNFGRGRPTGRSLSPLRHRLARPSVSAGPFLQQRRRWVLPSGHQRLPALAPDRRRSIQSGWRSGPRTPRREPLDLFGCRRAFEPQTTGDTMRVPPSDSPALESKTRRPLRETQLIGGTDVRGCWTPVAFVFQRSTRRHHRPGSRSGRRVLVVRRQAVARTATRGASASSTRVAGTHRRQVQRPAPRPGVKPRTKPRPGSWARLTPASDRSPWARPGSVRRGLTPAE